MPKNRKDRRGRDAGSAPPPSAPAEPISSASKWPVLAGMALLVGAAGMTAFYLLRPPEPAPSPVAQVLPAAQFVGTATCAGCHREQHEAWRGSHHDLAMQEATRETMLGNFANAKVAFAGITSTFIQRDGRFFVNTDGPDGKLADFEIKYAFGVAPLQQYLVELPGGRLQALGIAWDARPKAAGGQRWFHLYPNERLRAGDPLHWTGIQQNWNFMCADCHSTNLRKGYDAATKTFKTTWSEIDVGCEACHGAGSNHVAWAQAPKDVNAAASGYALAARLDERKGVRWTMDPATGNAARSAPRESEREIETCARCHARRGQLTDAVGAADSFHQGFRAARLERGLYHADGQQRDEVYTWGSFLQSRMHAKGVTCSDCHEPHSTKLRAAGNAVCAQCHAPAKYDAASHHMHAPGTPGAACTACHMPTTTYMVVDPRHDHGFRVPRPDLTAKFGTPNACNGCHTKQTPLWAAGRIAAHTGRPPGGLQRYAEAFALFERGDPAAASALLGVLDDASQPAIARASALTRLAIDEWPFVDERLAKALNDASPVVRTAAIEGLSSRGPEVRLRYLPRMLADPMRVVRIEAARSLADVPEAQLPAESRAQFRAALDEYVAVQRFDADRPEGQSNLGNVLRDRDPAAAADAYRTAIALDPSFVPAYVNLADLQRSRGSETVAEATLRGGLKANPSSGALHHSLGLSLVRQGRKPEALAALAKAAQLEPTSARNAYVYAVALHDAGRRAEAVDVLERSLQRHPHDRDTLEALSKLR